MVSKDAQAGVHTTSAYLAARGLGEPQCPCVHERVLDVEVLGVMEDSADLALICCVAAGLFALCRVAGRRDGNRVERNLLVAVCGCGDFGHCVGFWGVYVCGWCFGEKVVAVAVAGEFKRIGSGRNQVKAGLSQSHQAMVPRRSRECAAYGTACGEGTGRN